MKLLIVFLFAFFSSVALADHAEHKHMLHDGQEITVPELQAGLVDPKGELISVTVHGLVCDFCAQAIEKVFMRKDQVSGISVNLEESLIVISLKANQTIDDSELTKLIVDSGYNVESISRKAGEAHDG